MRHDTAIPRALHDEAVASVKGALGAFWSSLFRDQGLVDALLAARVLGAGQLSIDAMEALSLRDHAGSPVLHREHWHPLVIRLSRRNTATALTVGMPDTPVVGAQDASGDVYLPGEVFVVGGNAAYSKVNTYPIEVMEGRPLVRVVTALCDSVSVPRHVLSQGRDFSVERGVLVIRKEQDPFDSDGYRIEGDGDDRIAVLWACDAEFDHDYVSDFLGYPLGLHAPSTEAASRMLSALWDAVTLGLTPTSLNKILGAVFDVPMVERDTAVESVTADGDDSIVVTGDRVYRIETSRLSELARTAGSALKAGSFLTDEVRVHWGLSADDVAELHARGLLGRIVLPPGSVAGVDETVVIEPGLRTVEEDGWWFRLNDGDSADSPFWRAVFARTTEEERKALCGAMGWSAASHAQVNPFEALGPVALANHILVRTTRAPLSDPSAGLALDYLHRLVPAFASLLVVQETDASDGRDALVLALDRGLEMFDLDSWAQSGSCGTNSTYISAVAREGADIVVTAAAHSTSTAYQYTAHTRSSLSGSGVYAMHISPSAGHDVAGVSFSGVSSHTDSVKRSLRLYWFYYDKDGNFIAEGYKSVSVNAGASVSWTTTSVPPAGACYVSVFFAVQLGTAGVSWRTSGLSVRPVFAQGGDSVSSAPTVTRAEVDSEAAGGSVFDMAAWAASSSNRPYMSDRTSVSSADGVVTVTALVASTSSHYTNYKRLSLADSRVYAMPIPDGIAHFPGSDAHLSISGTAAHTRSVTTPFSVWWFYYDEDGKFIGDRSEDRPDGYVAARSFSIAADTTLAWKASTVPPAGARYVSVFFAARLDEAGAELYVRDIAVRGVFSGMAAVDDVFFRLIPVAATEV